MKKYSYLWKNILVLLVAVLFAAVAAHDFLAMRTPEPVVASKGLTRVARLSEYCANLKGTVGDEEVYVFDSGVPGGTFLVLGGTHPNESAGMMAAIAMAENIEVTEGRVFIMPWTNTSGFTHTSPLDGMQDLFTITLKDGSTRTFRVGNRLTNPVDQWPDRPEAGGHGDGGDPQREPALSRQRERRPHGAGLRGHQEHDRPGERVHRHGHARGLPGVLLSGHHHGP